jgi:hypothetical protein
MGKIIYKTFMKNNTTAATVSHSALQSSIIFIGGLLMFIGFNVWWSTNFSGTENLLQTTVVYFLLSLLGLVGSLYMLKTKFEPHFLVHTNLWGVASYLSVAGLALMVKLQTGNTSNIDFFYPNLELNWSTVIIPFLVGGFLVVLDLYFKKFALPFFAQFWLAGGVFLLVFKLINQTGNNGNYLFQVFLAIYSLAAVATIYWGYIMDNAKRFDISSWFYTIGPVVFAYCISGAFANDSLSQFFLLVCALCSFAMYQVIKKPIFPTISAVWSIIVFLGLAGKLVTDSKLLPLLFMLLGIIIIGGVIAGPGLIKKLGKKA